CGHKGEWIMRLQTIELGANQTAERKRQQRSNGKPGATENDNLLHDHPKDIALQRTERHADTDLPPAPRDTVGHHAIEAKHREGWGQSAEYRGKTGEQPFCLERKAN